MTERRWEEEWMVGENKEGGGCRREEANDKWTDRTGRGWRGSKRERHTGRWREMESLVGTGLFFKWMHTNTELRHIYALEQKRFAQIGTPQMDRMFWSTTTHIHTHTQSAKCSICRCLSSSQNENTVCFACLTPKTWQNEQWFTSPLNTKQG